MKITEISADISRLHQERDKAHQEMVDAIVERDKVFSEIAAQRSGKIEVSSQKTILEQMRFLLVSQIENLKRLSSDTRDTFQTVYERQSKYLQSLLEKIELNEEEVLAFVSKQEEIEEMETKLKARKSELIEIQESIVGIKDDMVSDWRELDREEDRLSQKETMLEDKEKELFGLRDSLQNQENELKWSKELHELTVKEFMESKTNK